MVEELNSLSVCSEFFRYVDGIVSSCFVHLREKGCQSSEQSPGYMQQGSPPTWRPEECGEDWKTSRPFHLYVHILYLINAVTLCNTKTFPMNENNNESQGHLLRNSFILWEVKLTYFLTRWKWEEKKGIKCEATAKSRGVVSSHVTHMTNLMTPDSTKSKRFATWLGLEPFDFKILVYKPQNKKYVI